MKFKAGLILFLCAMIAPCLAHAQKPASSDCKVVGTPPICLFDTSYCPTTTEVACQIGSDVDTLLTYVNADSVITGVVNQTSGSTTVTGQDGISVGVTYINESNMDFFDGWFYPATFNVTSTGTYNLSGGTLTAGFETTNGIMNQSGTSVNTLQSNPNGSAVYIHCMGLGAGNCTTIDEEQGTVGQLNVVGTGAQYNLESGTLNAPTLVLDSGGTFTQTGGVANVVEGQTEDENITTQPKSGLYVGYNGAGTYTLSGATSVLKVGGATTINSMSQLFPGYEYIGYNAGSIGTFNQSAGTNILGAADEVAGFLYVGYGGTGTYNLSGGTLGGNYPTYEYIGYNVGSMGTFDQTGGINGPIKSGDPSIAELYVGYLGTGTYTLGKTGGSTTSATLSAGNELIGSQNFDSTTDAYVNGVGTFTQNAGTNQVGGLFVGYQSGVGATPIGTYSLVGGSLTSFTTGEGAIEYIGFEGYGVFNQSGGKNNADSLILGEGNSTSPGLGIYNLSGTGSLTVCCSDEIIGQGTDTANAFNQSGGTNTTLSIVIGNSGEGTYNLSKGTLKVGDLVLGEGSGTTSAAFVQTGGTVDMIFTLDGFSEAGTLTVAQTGTGSYDLTKGNLNAGDEYVAEGEGSVGTFTQANGTNSVGANDYLYVGYGGQGTYSLSGGTVKAHEEIVGGGNGINSSGNGTFTEKGGTNTITASGGTAGNLEIGDVATGTYQLYGGKLTAVSLTINSTGSMVIDKTGSAAITFTISGTTMNDGVMSFTDASASLGAFTNDGSLALNATTSKAGKLTLGTYTQGSGGTLTINLDGTTAGTNYYELNISGAATLGGTLDLSTGFAPVVGDTWDILNYTSETGSFSTINLPTAPAGDHYVFSCGAKDCSLTLDSGPAVASATKGKVSGSPAKRVSRGFGASDSYTEEKQPVAILSRATCFAARLLASASCGMEVSARGASADDAHESASASAGDEVHNNIMVATRSIALERRGASHGASASAAEMARLYVCAYLPVSVAHSMGCN
jgi:fibronectin-binding autotransporter adhesin